jgi:tetratricopeptide (TPR) repeat protein
MNTENYINFDQSKARYLHLAILIPVFVLIFYSNIFQNKFLYDDEFLIIKNSFLRSWEFIGVLFVKGSTAGAGGHDTFYRPLQNLLYLVTFQIFGLSTVMFHALNLALHCINAVFVFVLARALKINAFWCLFASMLWALHPMHTEAVTYMSATADSLYTAFVLGGLIVLLPNFSNTRIIASLALFILALLSKESAIIFPGLLIIFIYFYAPLKIKNKSLYISVPYLMVAGAYLLWRRVIFSTEAYQMYKTANVYSESLMVRFYTFLATLPAYAKLLLWPVDLHMDRQFPVSTHFFEPVVLIGAGLLLLAAALLIVPRFLSRTYRILSLASFLVQWFFAAHFTQTGVIIPVNAMFLEHWMYLPTIGVFIAMIAMLDSITEGRRLSRLVMTSSLVLIVLLEGVATYSQNQVWKDPVTLYERILKHSPNNARIRNNLAMSYDIAGQFIDAEIQYKKAISISDEYPQTHHNLGLLFTKKGDIQGAIVEFRRALELAPNFFQAAQSLSDIYRSQGDLVQAEYFKQMYTKARKSSF